VVKKVVHDKNQKQEVVLRMLHQEQDLLQKKSHPKHDKIGPTQDPINLSDEILLKAMKKIHHSPLLNNKR